jgi:hypothetical protein
MPLRHAAYGPSNLSFEQSTSEKLTKLVRKLRWSGFEHEADRIQLVLNGVAQDQSERPRERGATENGDEILPPHASSLR